MMFRKTSIVPLKVYEIFYIKAKNGRKEVMSYKDSVQQIAYRVEERGEKRQS